MSSSVEPLDDVAAAMDEHLAKKPLARPTSTPDLAAAPAIEKPLKPWEAKGRKYPSALDYKGTATARHVNNGLATITETGDLAEKCLVGEATAATLDYYTADVDVHPLAQLAVAGLAFGVGYGLARMKKADDEKKEEAKKDGPRAKATDALTAALEEADG